MTTKNPFIAGAWVRGEHFFGRQPIIREILEGSRSSIWIAGTRRLGKTSILKQVEWLTTNGASSYNYVPIFWDLQGSHNIDGLKESLLESLEDAEERFAAIDVQLSDIEKEDVFGILRELRRKAKEHDRRLLLLCDEAEELINIEKNSPEALPKLRRALQKGDTIRTVLAATKRLQILEHSAAPETSPFLFGFVPPIYLGQLEDSEARRLIGLGNFDAPVVEEIMAKTNKHPYLLQLICRRLYETRDLQKVVEELSADDLIARFFAVDFQNLEDKDQQVLLHILQNKALTLKNLQDHLSEPPGKLIPRLHQLMHLGAIKEEDRQYKIANYFFENWLQQQKENLFSDSALKRAMPTQSLLQPEFDANELPKIGQTLGEHEILEKLGSGGMGAVFKGRDRKLNRTVALKVLLPAYMNDAEFRERFILEAQAASALNHPNVCTIYQIGEHNGVYFISMEFVEGQNLRAWRKANPSDFNKCLELAIQTGAGLAHAHSKNIVHRDIKPDNVMVTTEGVAKIMDFGLAKSLQRTRINLTKTGAALGTLCYMSPEQASGAPADHRSDIFSFGVLLYELFSGKLPFFGEVEITVLYSILNEEPAPLRQANPELPEPLERIVHHALQKDLDKRYQRMNDLVADLENVRRET
jgi:tRNA A-37 threonylcarbamoyl transferase component Bud32/predicted transcriptional regulator